MTGERWTPGEIRDFLAENVTVVAPGETLVIRAWEWMTPNQMREVQESLNAALEYGSISFKCLVVPGAELGKVAAPDDEQFAAKVARVIDSDAVRVAIRKMVRRDSLGVRQRNPAANP